MITTNDVFIDFETRSKAPLGGKSGVGSWRYSLDPSTKVLCLAYAFGNDEPMLWIEGQPPPRPLMHAIESGYRIHGWNSMSFERAVFENICKPKLGWLAPHPDQYHDTMLDALTLALPAKLGDCCKAMKTYNRKHEEEGKRLIKLLSQPIAKGRLKGLFREREEYMQDYMALYEYCRQDVRTERDIYKRLPFHLKGKERQLALLVMRMNERGLPTDQGLVDAVLEALEYAAEVGAEEFHRLTGIDRPTQRAKFLEWLRGEGVELPNMQKETLAGIDYSLLKPHVSNALRVYEDNNSSSTAKFSKIKTMICPDGTVKNNLIFNKASTGRLAGAGFQAQNLPAVGSKFVDEIMQCFIDRDYEFLQMYCGIQKAAKIMIRPTIRAIPHHKLISGDLKGVEARGTSDVAGEKDMLRNFKLGIDAYVASAADMYHIPLDQVTKEQRQAGKVAVLSGGFGGGYRALMRMAAKYGMLLTEAEAKAIVKAFRRARKKLPIAWRQFGEAAYQAVVEGGQVYVPCTEGRIFFFHQGTFLYMSLPSGRLLSFPFPEIREEMYFGRLQEVLTAMWVDNSPGGNHKWTRRVLTGPSLFQSAVQASCRDILFDSHLLVEEEGMPLILSVHDEAVSMVPDDPMYNTEMYGKLMTRVPEWCPNMPIDSDCWEGYRYRK